MLSVLVWPDQCSGKESRGLIWGIWSFPKSKPCAFLCDPESKHGIDLTLVHDTDQVAQNVVSKFDLDLCHKQLVSSSSCFLSLTRALIALKTLIITLNPTLRLNLVPYYMFSGLLEFVKCSHLRPTHWFHIAGTFKIFKVWIFCIYL